MDSNDAVPSGAFSEEEKLLDEDASWFSKNLGDESDNTVEHDVESEEISTPITQEKLSQGLSEAQDTDLITDGNSKPSEEAMETDSQSELLGEVSDSDNKLQGQKNELTELKDIELTSKKHDISNELKEMFEEKSSDAEELHEASLAKHSLDTDITKEDKLKDIVPDDILGKDDSFDELDNDALHQELEAHLTYEKNESVTEMNSENSVPNSQESEHDNQKEMETSSEVTKLDELSFKGKSELLNNITENIGTKEIDEIMQEGVPSEEDTNKDMTSGFKDISKVISDFKDDLENQLENITGELKEETEQKEESAENENVVNPVDKESIELNQENMMVEFAHGSGNQVLIQINTDKSEASAEDSGATSEGIVMETSDGQTLIFSSSEAVEPEPSATENDVSQVEGGAEFLQAVTGKLEDVLAPEPQKEEPAPVQTQPSANLAVEKKEPVKESPKCSISTCKSGKSGLKTTYRYFKPPVNKLWYKKWEYIFNQAKQELTPDTLICELHFRTGLIYKRGVDKFGKVVWALREAALPKLAPSGVLRLGSGLTPPPSTTVQVPKRQESLIKTPTTPVKAVTPLQTAKTASPISAAISPGTPKVLGKKILQKPVKTVATKVSNEVTDIGFLYKNPELVKVAQEEMANLDVLVCGECHSVFHILELFHAHKMASNCKGESNFKGNPSEPKPQVWAFLLWKSAQAKVADVESSWKLYQRWCKMEEKVRNSWIAAGKSLQEGNAIASLKLVDSPQQRAYPRPGRPPMKAKDSDDDEFPARKAIKRGRPGRPPASAPVSDVETSDVGGGGDFVPESEPMEVDNSHSSQGDREVDQTLDNLNRRTPELITSEVEIKQEVVSDDEQHDENKENNSKKNVGSDEIQNCDKCKKPISNPKGGVLCAGGCYGYYHVECTRLKTHQSFVKLGARKARWKCDFCKEASLQQETPKAQKAVSTPKQKEQEKTAASNNEEEEFVVEKIVSRRYNIKKKHYEYLLKWEGYPSEQNTWEPAENLGTCQHLLKAFEEALAKQQAAKQAAAARQQGGKQATPYTVKPPVIPGRRPPPTPTTPSTTTGRPQRSSKQKAMDQVKQWCGSIVRPSDDDNVGLKRKLSESDSEYEEDDEEVVIKKVKVEVESEDSEPDSFKNSTALGRPRGRPPQATTPRPVANKQVNGENLAAELGLESEDEDDPSAAAASPQKSPVVRKMSSLSPSKQQVLVASAKGVVTVDQKKMPNLASGVYIMSNKSGIVKVDNSKTLTTLQKSGVLKKPFAPAAPEKAEEDSPSSPQKLSSGVVVLPRSEAGSQQKVGVIRKTVASASTTQTTTTTSPSTPSTPSPATPKPAGLLKSGTTPRPLGLLRTTTSPPIRPQGQMPTTPNTNTKIQPMLRPKLATPARGRPLGSTLVKRPLGGGGLQATPQQKLLIAKKKAESEVVEPQPAAAVTPSPAPKPLMKPKTEAGVALPPIRSTNKVLAHPLLSRGRGRGYRGRGRGSSLSHLLQMREREPEPEPVKESRLVDSDNLLMEFQEPSESEDSDDGLEDIFPPLEELPPIVPDSPPRPLSLCPETGKVLCKAEGEKTPEPTPPPSPKAPTPPPAPSPKVEEPTHILPEIEPEAEPETTEVVTPAPVTVAVTTAPRPVTTTTTTTTAVVKQDGMICKVEMSPGGTTGTLVEAVSAATATPPGVTEGTVTIKKPLASRNRNLNRGPQLSVVPNTSSTSLGTITVPARKLFQEDNSDDNMVTITGEDGLVYQVSNSELAGNTLLVSSGEDGEQQCVYVTTGEDGAEGGSTILTLDSAYANAVAQLGSDQVNILSTEDGDQYFIKEDEVEGGEVMTLEGEEGLVAGDDQSGQVVAQLVEAGEPAPGGSRRVVLLLPDGNLMMTEVDEEQYAALDLDK